MQSPFDVSSCVKAYLCATSRCRILMLHLACSVFDVANAYVSQDSAANDIGDQSSRTSGDRPSINAQTVNDCVTRCDRTHFVPGAVALEL